MLPTGVLYYGKDEAPPERRALRAGPLSLVYEGGDLRYLALGDREVVRRIYVAVRDRHWGTVPLTLSNVRIEDGGDSFRIAYDATNRQGAIDFAWRGTIVGDAGGTIAFTMDGAARSTFLRNRIGICVLHPAACAGARCAVEHDDGTTEEGAFPRAISPHQPFMDMRAIRHEVAPGVWAEVRFEGDVFEMEDQRNWTDASFKTYSTPLRLPFPVEVPAGTRVAQAVKLSLQGAIPPDVAMPRASDDAVTVTVGWEAAGPLPPIGLGAASHGCPPSGRAVARLGALNLDHLRVDLRLADPGYPDALRRAVAEARALDVPLQIALLLSERVEDALAALDAVLDEVEPPVRAWLVFHERLGAVPEGWIALARERLRRHAPDAPVGSGTNGYFTHLNRERPPVEALDLVAYSLNPQAHAFDNASLVETFEGQAATVESARGFIGALPLAVGPVTLKPRFNPDVALKGAPDPPPAPDVPPPQVDVRQMSLFAAGWTVGSLKALAEGGADSLTYYETSGPRGVLETEEGSPWPGRFHSIPGAVFPLYHVLADVCEFAGGEVVPTVSGAPLRIEGLAVRKGGRTRLLLASFAHEPRRVIVRGLAGRARVRLLDETNAEAAMREPELFRAGAGVLTQTDAGALELRLPPYAVARIDTAS